jgi:hypothetical protein
MADVLGAETVDLTTARSRAEAAGWSEASFPNRWGTASIATAHRGRWHIVQMLAQALRVFARPGDVAP